MSKIERENKKESAGYEYPEYTNKELRELETLLNTKYLIKKVLSDGKEYQWYDEEQWQKDNGGLGNGGGVLFNGMLPIQYEINRDKLSKMYKLQGMTSFAKKKEMEEIEKLVEQVKVDIPIEEIPVDDDDPLKF